MRIDAVAHARFLGDDLLRAQRRKGRVLRGEIERLVPGVGVERLRPAENGGERLERDADDVVLDLLRRQRAAGRLRVEAEQHRALAPRAEPLLHDPGPEAPRRAELRDLLEEVVVHAEEEGEARREIVDRQAPRRSRLRRTTPRPKG